MAQFTAEQRWTWNERIDTRCHEGYRWIQQEKDQKVSDTVLSDRTENHEQLRHPNLVHVFDIFKERNTRSRTFDRRTFIWMERAATDLHRMASEAPSRKIPDQTLAPLMSYALIGLDFLHDELIAHRDLKPANILVFETPHGTITKITDYSLIKETNHNSLTMSIVGTTGYRPPSMLSKIGYNPFKADVFAMGITVFELIVGRKPIWNPDHTKGKEFVEAEFENLIADVDMMLENHDLQEFLLESVLLWMTTTGAMSWTCWIIPGSQTLIVTMIHFTNRQMPFVPLKTTPKIMNSNETKLRS